MVRYFLMAAVLMASTAHSASAKPVLHGDHWHSFDDSAFPFLKWLPAKAAPKALVVGVHGLSGAAEDYEQLGEKLAGRGMGLYAYELRGQGNDPVKKRVGDIKKREHWFADLDSFVSKVRASHPGVPVFLYGESLGSLIIMHGLPHLSTDNQKAVKGLMFGSPVVGMVQKLPPVQNFFVHAAIKVLPCVKVSLLKLAGGQDVAVADGNDHFEQMLQTPHFVEKFSLRLLGTVEKMIEGSAAVATPIKNPILVLYAGKDVFAAPKQVEAFYEKLGTKDKTKQLFEDSHHLLFYDKQREDVFKLIGDWVEKRK